jgi:glycosyltransferase involved in cell wall biosynthesis
MCGFYREDQFATGAYSFSENLMRGFASLRRSMQENASFELVVFHGSKGLRWTDEQLTYRRITDPWGRFPAESRVGLVDSAGLDAVLFPNSFTPPVVRSQRVVTVIHDLQYLLLPEYWPLAKRVWMRANHEITLRRCDAVVAISQSVRNDILTHYGHRWESRVHAIWNAVSLDRLTRPAEQIFTNGRPYILCAAVDRPPKNLSTLIRAFALLRNRYPDHCLVLAGQLRTEDRTWRRRSQIVESKLPGAMDLVNELGLSKHVVLTGFIPDEQLGALYRGAALFVLPSLFEGFGMPAVESLALGTPTLVSDLPVLREVTLDRAYYIADPLNERQMADEIAQVLALGEAARPSSDFRDDIRQRFAPETIARQYLKLLVGDG